MMEKISQASMSSFRVNMFIDEQCLLKIEEEGTIRRTLKKLPLLLQPYSIWVGGIANHASTFITKSKKVAFLISITK